MTNEKIIIAALKLIRLVFVSPIRPQIHDANWNSFLRKEKGYANMLLTPHPPASKGRLHAQNLLDFPTEG